MARDLKVIQGGVEGEAHRHVPAERRLAHFRNVKGSILQEALDTWGEVWDQLQGSMTHGVLIDPEVEKNFEPECGWPELLEKIWLLRHHLDYAKRLCDGKL
ncbi:MAG: hypothetical protein Kow0099_28310 [Candidatus Abyssubacteria bacterium]